jgi:hypothetical protein
MERGTGEARLEQGDHATLLQRRAPLIEDLMPSENREEQGLHATATRAGRGEQKVAMSAVTLRWRTPPSITGKGATGLIC